MAGSSSKSAVLVAVAGNSLLTVLKFGAFLLSGSGAMFSEALHSLADTGNQALLFIGIRRSEAPADAAFHYGRGGERFLWSLFSAIGIFLLGCGVTLYHGVHSLMDPPELSFHWSIFVVLFISLVVDGLVLWKAAQVVHELRGERGFFAYLKQSSDPTLLAVLLEDSVACLGVLIALAGILFAKMTGSHIPDVIATFLIGGMMGLIAVWLGYKNSALIIGQSIPASVEAAAVDFLRAQPSVLDVGRIKSRIVGSDNFRIKAGVDWNGSKIAEGMLPWVEEQAEHLSTPDGRRAFTIEFGERMTDAVAVEVDRIEGELMVRHPELRHLDLESD